jgi:hypothetical protein
VVYYYYYYYYYYYRNYSLSGEKSLQPPVFSSILQRRHFFTGISSLSLSPKERKESAFWLKQEVICVHTIFHTEVIADSFL